MNKLYDIGLVGLSVMGRSLALNMADHGFRVAGYNRSSEPTEIFVEAGKAAGYTVTGEGDPAIDALVLARYEAKKAKNFAEADRIRDELKAQGIEIIDTKGGASWKRV